jgi:hypothetical protein
VYQIGWALGGFAPQTDKDVHTSPLVFLAKISFLFASFGH